MTVGIANDAEVAPAGTVTVAGAVVLPLLEVRLTTVPAPGALPLRVTVPVADVPPITALGEIARLDSTAGLIVTVAVFAVVPWVAVIVAVVPAATAIVETVKVAVDAPAATVTVP